nr:uncharacterized protein LOC131780773 [Pocillopora verrucosa]
MAQFNLCFRVAFLAVLLPLTSGACVDIYLGMESGTIPDSDITASSVQSANTPAKNGRLNYTSGSSWCAGTGDTNPYLQIDLKTLHIICAVSTQGNSKADQWVKTYKLQLSTDGTTWTNYTELGGQAKVLEGNKDRNSNVKHVVYGVLTRYLRFLPQTHQGEVCMRTEVFGVKQTPTCDSQAIGLASGGRIPDDSFSASSIFKATYAAKYGRLNGRGAWEPKTTTDPNDYLQIDLLYEYVICAVATQGNPPSQSQAQEWTTEYKLRFSLNGTTFLPYKENKIDKAFPGNTGKTDTVKNSLKEFASAKFIRFLPTKYNKFKVLRVEAYGILFTKVPSQPPTAFKLTASSSTSITASWQLPPVFARHGRNITGFKLFYKKKGCGGSATTLTISSGSILSRNVTGLDKLTEYEFQVLAFTSDGDGPKSPVEVKRTKGAGCVESYLGMENGAIPDNKLTASTEQSANTPAKNGRMNYISGSSWCARASDTNPYLQIDLQTLHIICAVSTQGNSQADQWVKTYTLQLSTDGITWTLYKELGGQVKVLEGNKDRNSNVKHVLYGVLTRYLRFLPQTHQGEVCMRTEVFGVQQKPTCDSQAIGLASSGRIPDDSFSASSIFHPRYAAKYGRLNGKMAWEPKTNGHDDYLQIDLLYEYIICAVATQGSPPSQSQAQEWTTEYKLRFSLNGTTFSPYKENKIDKAFLGNSGKTDTVKNSLKEFASAKFIRFLPTKYNKFKALRVEAYGILLAKVPSQPPTAFKLTATSSISIAASWQLPPVYTRHATIKGFKLFYTKKVSGLSVTILTISGESTLSKNVTGLDKYTEYEFQVLAFTSDGDGPKSSVEVERTMEDVPSQPPSNFMVNATSSTSVGASWQLPAENSRNGIIKGFKLFYKKKSSSVPGTVLLINSESMLNRNVTGLDKYTEYEFQVLAFTSTGDGPKSSVVVKRTKEDVPSKPPSGFNLTASSSTSITASWQLPLENSRNGIIKGFKLFYQKKGSAGSELMRHITDQAKRLEEVSSLDKFTEYEFEILAFTSVGDGPKSSILTERTKEDAPSQPPSQFSVFVNSSTSITASWQLPPVGSRHGIVKGYKIFYKKKGSGFATTLTLDNGNTSRRFTKLDEYTEYEFQVLAFTSAGDGPNSSSVFRTTMEDAPSAPISLSSVDVPPSNLHGPRITLTWSEPAEPNGVIRNYTLFYSHDGVAPREISGIGKDALNHTLDVLGGVTYRFDVRAVTIKPGPNRTITVMSREYEPSRGPEGISSSAVNSRKINITWLGLSREVAYGTIINYEVRLSVEENCTEIQSSYPSTINTTATYILVTGLSLCAKYAVSVRGYTAVGPGPYSRSVMERIFRNPVIKDLPKRTVVALNELVVLTCEVNGDSEVSVTWTKDGLTSIPRAQFKNSGKILVIQNVVPGDSGVYECIATNRFGESRTASTLIVAVPPSIIKEVSPSSVMCEKQTLCLVLCQATSYIPFNYSWTKDGQVPTGDGIKLMNNSIVVTPRDAQDYGQYVCHASNSFGSTKYQITLLAPKDTQCNDGTQSILLAIVIALSCLVVVSLIMNGVFTWQRRRAVKSSPDQQSSDQQASVPSLYMELKPRPTNQQSHVPTEYQSLQEKPGNPGYCNVVFQRENGGKQNDEIYEEI